MARIFGVDLPREKRVDCAGLTPDEVFEKIEGLVAEGAGQAR